jgi:hypothetical protein
MGRSQSLRSAYSSSPIRYVEVALPFCLKKEAEPGSETLVFYEPTRWKLTACEDSAVHLREKHSYIDNLFCYPLASCSSLSMLISLIYLKKG